MNLLRGLFSKALKIPKIRDSSMSNLSLCTTCKYFATHSKEFFYLHLTGIFYLHFESHAPYFFFLLCISEERSVSCISFPSGSGRMQVKPLLCLLFLRLKLCSLSLCSSPKSLYSLQFVSVCLALRAQY